MVRGEDGWFIDEGGRRLILRGCNLGGDCKTPYRARTALPSPGELYDYRAASFVGRPLPEAEAGEHLDRLARWGFNAVRLLVTWEGLEPTGPGEYDDTYYDYIERLVAMAAERGLRLFVDPHQDAWSRWTGGDGAPAWTLERVGFDVTRLHRSGAAFVHEEAGDPYPRMRWPSNYSRLACQTMFTLFFAGDDYAPSLRIDGLDSRSFLQGSYLAAVARLAGRLARYDAVIGVDTLNEPSDGYIGLTDLSRLQRAMAKTGPMPSPFEAMATGSGYPTEVDVYGVKGLGQGVVGRETLGEHGVSAWKDGTECLWRREGVWDVACGKPVLKRPDYFARARGAEPDFAEHYLRPFARRVGEAVSKAAGAGRSMLFIESVPTVAAPRWDAEDAKASGVSGAANAGHWYDGFTLFMKRRVPFIAYDQEEERVILGRGAVRRYYAEHLGRLKRRGLVDMDGAPTLIGEFGLPYDLNGAAAYRTGDYRVHVEALSAYYDAMDENLLSATIWNYTASNTHERGDGWNGEDLSIWCRDDHEAGRTESGDPADAGGRALAGFVRPYARATAGLPRSMRFDRKSGRFEYVFEPRPTGVQARGAGPKAGTEAQALITELYVPEVQYPRGFSIRTTGCAHAVEDRPGHALVLVRAEPGATRCRVVVERARA
ncbi:MAG TPA: cellulase family glycosylhydrolase [Spirochaetales bacterium]|nr:cellulase family glycosylhydrolase [Spirochaetales bacterium]HPM72079.1 cellulase family glycosylhydrolase [Spirochaetales bacterium]